MGMSDLGQPKPKPAPWWEKGGRDGGAQEVWGSPRPAGLLLPLFGTFDCPFQPNRLGTSLGMWGDQRWSGNAWTPPQPNRPGIAKVGSRIPGMWGVLFSPPAACCGGQGVQGEQARG